MHLKALEINGFKSFAEKINIDFTKGITSVVGPNGSGKSNILDAILWVLGEQSYKNIRAKASTDVIFSGGKNKKAKSFAEVTLVVDNLDGQLSLDAEEVRITRHISDKGENSYFINDERARLRDIQELFMDTGVGKSAYSVIGQGKVERIISSSIKEIRSIIEEAAGIKNIKLRKEEATRKLDKVKIEIDKIAYVEKELKSNLNSITKQAEKAMEYQKLEQEGKVLQKSILTKEIELKQVDFKEESRKEEEIKLHLESLQDKFEKREIELEEVLESRQEINGKYEEIEKENREFKEKLELKVNEKVRLLESLNFLKKEIWEKNETLISIEKKLENKNEELLKFKNQEQELNKYIENEEYVHEEENVYIEDLEDKYYKLEEDLQKSKEKILDFEVEKIKFINDIEEADKKEKSFNKRKEELCAEKEEIESKLIENKNEFHEAKEKKLELENEKIRLGKEREQLLKNRKEAEEALRKAKNIKDEEEYQLRAKRDKYEHLKKVAESSDGYFKGVKMIMNKEIRGVLGPILSLIEIPDKFLKAIEISAGSNLQDVVVENASVATECIEFLRSNKGGRASFLPLDRIKPTSLSYTFRDEKIYGTANEIVKFPFNIKKAVDFVFSKILIVDDMETALSVQKKGTFKGTIVTLEGDIVSTSGRISGGEKVKSASSVIFERKREIKGIEEEIEILLKKNTKNATLYTEAQVRYEEIEKNIILIEKNHEEMRKNYETALSLYNTLLLEISQKEKHLQLVDYELSELETTMKDYMEKANKAKEEIKRLEEGLEEIRKNNENLALQKEEEKKILDKIKKENSGKKMTYIARVEERKQIKRTVVSIENQIKELNDEITKIVEFSSKSKDERIKTEQRIEEISELINKENEEYENKTSNVVEIKSKIDFYESEEKKLLVELKNIETEIVKEEGKLQIATEKVSKISFQLKELELKLEEIKDIEGPEFIEDLKDSKDKLKEIEKKIASLGYVNMLALEEYESAKEKFDFISTQKEDLVTSKKNLENLIYEIEENIKNSFFDAFNEIDNNFNYMCKEILNNSTGNLKLVEENDLLESGVELMVKYKNKKSQSLSLLSGGEKSMVAVALIMAIFMYKPSPFTFFDEIEAALDESNTKRLINKLKEFTDKSQFILITHNKYTMKESDTLYGVTMNKEIGESKILSVKL
jgi:chromosome segregation protein